MPTKSILHNREILLSTAQPLSIGPATKSHVPGRQNNEALLLRPTANAKKAISAPAEAHAQGML